MGLSLDQQGYQRLGIFYFSSFDDDVPLLPLLDSPLVQQMPGVTDQQSEGPPLLMKQWRNGRVAAYGTSQLKKSETEKGIEEEVIRGVRVKHYAS